MKGWIYLRKVTEFIVNKRHFILILFIILTIISGIYSAKVNINHDISKYLPDTSETRIGMDIMEREFEGTETSSLNLMFENLPENEKIQVKTDLENINGVDEVDYDNTENYNKDKYTLYVITVDDKSDSEMASDVYEQVSEKYKDYTIYTSGDVSDTNKTVLPIWIIILAVACALVILIIMCESYVEPFLFLTSILMAVVLNKGTNIIFPSVSHITNSIVAILQMALSMDYSIMLMNRYDQEKKTEKDNVKAMKNALYKAFQAISSSSITTIVGLLALVFMSFKIGKDLGFVLAKGVLFSLICIFFVLPSLILMFDKYIVKTKKKAPNIKLGKLGKISYKFRFLSAVIFIVIFLISFVLKGNLGIDYTEAKTDEIADIFDENNQMAIIYKNEDEQNVSKFLDKIENDEKVDEVLGYGNTINQKLTYDKLNDKLKDLGSDVSVEDYLLKILYYDYYNSDKNNKMTFYEFINFIENEAYNNEKLNDKIDEKTKKDITRLKNFVAVDSINKKRTTQDIAGILEMDEEKINDIFIYYLSQKKDIEIDLNEFISFMNKDVVNNKKYSDKIDNKAKSQLKTLSKFTNKKTIKKKMKSSEMAKLFGIDNNVMNELYQYYILKNDINIKMTIPEFSSFVLNDVLKDEKYAKSFDKATIENIKLLFTFSNKSTITKQMNNKELPKLFGIDVEKINKILLLKYMQKNSTKKLSITEFINAVIDLKNHTNYLDNVDVSELQKVSYLLKNKDEKMNKDGLKQAFDSVASGLVDNVFYIGGLPDEMEITPKMFIDLVCSQIDDKNLDEKTLNSLNLLKLILDDSESSSKVKYSTTQMAKLLNMELSQVNQLYVLTDLNNISEWTASPIELVKLILDNRELPEIKGNIDQNNMKQLELLSVVMNYTVNGKKLTYKEFSKIINSDAEKIKSIYTLYISKQNNIEMTPQKFVDFVIQHREDKMLSGKISSDTMKNLKLLQTVMDGVINNKKYDSSKISSLLGMDKNDTKLLFGLYSSKYKDKNLKLSLKEFVNFLLSDVITNEEYSNNFDEDKISKLNSVDSIMDATENNTEYTKDEIFAILSTLSDDVEKNTVEILYTYYGSNRQYNEKWEMTVEEFVNFLNNDILNDERFNDFIDDEMRNNITDAKDTISDARELLIGDEYSRVIINTKYPLESKETFDFVQRVKDISAQNVDTSYVIGDSPMAYEMSQTFDDELNFMTIITMIAIFVVVVATFKSLIVPIILVLLIQCAVYLTMGILSFVGENVYFISILIVQSILMGATIDYAILYTSYYLEHRKSMGIKEAIIESYNKSINTILTSSSILIIVTLIIANFASAIAAKICKTISEGTLCSTILILVLLPSVLAFWDKFIVKKK